MELNDVERQVQFSHQNLVHVMTQLELKFRGLPEIVKYWDTTHEHFTLTKFMR